MEKWLNSKEFRTQYSLTSANLWRWENTGKVKTKVVNRKKYYLVEDSKDAERINVIYCRVSNTKQSEDLLRQERLLREYCVAKGVIPDNCIKEVASGMNENRKGLNDLIELVVSQKVDKVVVSYKDRLTRFGFDYFKNLFLKFGTTIEVVNLTTEEDFQSELTEDLVSIIHHFSMKMYSNRRKQLKQLKDELVKDTNEEVVKNEN
jgi:predicted site-specific integrase-resolvase